ncbi:Sensor protein [Candidatus Paraburkholderia kirkii]|nr:Sensor protein [Candidatus Paraburkholderia kirkii]
MERALKSGQSLTRQLLGVARKQPLRSETIAIGKWVPAGRELLRASLGAKVALSVEVAPDVWAIRVDPVELELALINVAVNARDAMPNGGTFTVRADNVQRALPSRGRLSDHRRFRADLAGRHRLRHELRGARARLRAALHHQAEGHGHGSRPAAGVCVLRARGRARDHR